MSLTSYRTAPPRARAGNRKPEAGRYPAIRFDRGNGQGGLPISGFRFPISGFRFPVSGVRSWRTWRRPTLPRLETQYHRRCRLSRPSSEWDRVGQRRYGHQVGEGRTPEVGSRKVDFRFPECMDCLSAGVRAADRSPGVAFRGPVVRRHPVSGLATSAFRSPAFFAGHGGDCQAFEPLVPVSSTCCHASTSGLSTWWSSTAL